MKIQLIDINNYMAVAYQKAFEDRQEIFVKNGSAFSEPTEAIVSPANSYAFLDGGFDAVITRVLGSNVQINAQKKVKDEYNGELLVGQACYIETGSDLVPYCILAPTMRCPTILGDRTVNPYLAARAIFLLLKQENLPFKSVTIPGLGTGVGQVPYELCAHQVRKAYDDFYVGNYKFPLTWKEAMDNHQKLYKKTNESLRDLQFKP